MSLRNTEIAGMLRRWLERFSPPASIKDNPRAAQDSADALLRALLKFAPQADYVPWVNRALDATETQMKTRAWPTVHEIGAVCSNMRKDEPRHGGSTSFSLDPFEVAARRVHNHQPIGDMWIYGHHAHEIVARGLVTDAQLQPYRSGLFFQMKAAWGEEQALAVEAEFRRRHAAAAPVYQKVGAA